MLNVTNVFNLRYHGTNQNKTFQTLLIRPNSSFHLQDCGTDGIFSGHQPRQFRKAGQRFEQRTCLHHQISVWRDVTAILDTLIRLKLKTQDVSKHDFVSVFRWEEMNSLLVGPAEQAGHCYCIGVRSSLPPSIWRRGKFRSPKPCGVFNLWRTTTATTLRNSLILSQKCIAPSSQNFKAKRQICWLSLSETIVSSQLKRRVLVEAQSLMKYKGFSYLGFYKNSGKASRFKFVNYKSIGAEVPTYGNACRTRFTNVLRHISYLASTHSSVGDIYTLHDSWVSLGDASHWSNVLRQSWGETNSSLMKQTKGICLGRVYRT